jgi:hypothetical protein
VEKANIRDVKSPVTDLPRGVVRDQWLARVAEARRRVGERRSGRAWINGREVGGPDPRFAHLAVTHD